MRTNNKLIGIILGALVMLSAACNNANKEIVTKDTETTSEISIDSSYWLPDRDINNIAFATWDREDSASLHLTDNSYKLKEKYTYDNGDSSLDINGVMYLTPTDTKVGILYTVCKDYKFAEYI